jgi:peptide/nickel transport system substrate-binding protein
MIRRDVIRGLAFTGLAASAACGRTGSHRKAVNTLRIIHSQNLASLDPIFTTEPATKDFGFLSYDQLVAVDENFVPKPQMAQGWSVEDDGRSWVFGLRDGLKFHSGEPVRSQDCIPSIRRWGVRDGFGQLAMSFIDDMQVIDDKKFRIKLKQPFALLPDALGKATASECFIMPEHLAKTDPMKPITEEDGSGPYRFLKEEWVSGSHAAWARFDGYVPRKEPVDGTAGGRIPAVARIDWSVIGDPSTAMAALIAGEQDFWDTPPADLVPTLRSTPHIRVETRLKTGAYLMLQFNHLQPPFNNLPVRRAVAMAVDQRQILQAVTNDPKMMRPCYSYYPCGTPYASEAGAEVIKVADITKAKAALKASGYAGQKVVFLGLQEGALGPVGQLGEDLLRRLGMNVELVTVDFATMAQRRLSKAPVEQGGWSAFITGWTGGDILNPAVNPMMRGSGEKAFPGWADDPELETLRHNWAAATDPADRSRLATAIQIQAFKTLPYLPLGSFFSQCAFRDDVIGVFPAPAAVYWNIGKRA